MSIQNTAPSTALLHAALAYAARGWRVLPLHTMRVGRCSCNRANCPSPAKHPRTMNGSAGASSDFAQIRKWWGMWPEANIGIATGGDLAVVDLDVSRNGIENWEALADDNGGPLDALTVRTGGGGKHLYVRVPHKVQNSVDKLALGVDVRGEGGYVVAPPSVHASGREYTWLDCDPVDDAVSMTDAPTWLLAKIANMRVVSAPDSPAVDAFPKGQRNSGLFGIARRMRAMGLGYDEMVPSLLDVNDRRCFPPLDPAEVKQIARSASGYEAGTSAEIVAAHIAARTDAPTPEDPGAPDAPMPDERDDDWRSSLRRKKNGDLETSFGNACLVLRNADGYAGTLAYDEMALRPTWSGRPMTDGLMGILRERLEREHGLAFALDTLTHAVLTVAGERSYHPVRAYLSTLQWDGVERLSGLARNALHVDDRLSAQLVRKWMLAAVRRAFDPGVKVDTVLVLVGEQGGGKSSFFKALASPAWFGDSAIDVTNKDAVLQMRAAWIYELAEIDGLTSRKHAADVKAFATSATDTIRVPYGRAVEPVPRSSVMCGTTNKDGFLTDDTGARRYWIVRVPDLRQIEYSLVAEQRDQLWAEAVAAVREGEDHWLGPDQELDLRARAREHMEADPWEPVIETWMLGRSAPPTTTDILVGALRFDPKDVRREHESRIGRVMHALRYRSTRSRQFGSRRVYVRDEPADPPPTDPTDPTTPSEWLASNGEEKSSGCQPIQPIQPVPTCGRAQASASGADGDPDPLSSTSQAPIEVVGAVGAVGAASVLSGGSDPTCLPTTGGGWHAPAAPKPAPPWSKKGAA